MPVKSPAPSSGPGAEDRDLTTLVFDDNRLLAPLFGEHDEHLALIEHRLGVDITPRGNRIVGQGFADSPRQCPDGPDARFMSASAAVSM